MCEHHHYTDRAAARWHCKPLSPLDVRLDEVRDWIGDVLTGWQPEAILDAQLLACELVTHVLTHAYGAGDIALTEPLPSTARIEVTALTDPDQWLLPCGHQEILCRNAMRLIDELAASFGSGLGTRGNIVWGELLSTVAS